MWPAQCSRCGLGSRIPATRPPSHPISIWTRRYAHVNASCLLASPAARWYRQWVAAGGAPEGLHVHIEAAADVDGIAVKW